MFEGLTFKERETLIGKLHSAALQFIHEYDALKGASPVTVASYGRTALATDWLMCCVETGQIRRELEALRP